MHPKPTLDTTKPKDCIFAEEQKNDRFDFVCGSDGKVYDNPEDLEVQRACHSPKLTLVSVSLLMCRPGANKQYLG